MHTIVHAMRKKALGLVSLVKLCAFFLRSANNEGNKATCTYEEEGGCGGDMAQVAKVKVEVVDQASGVVGTVFSYECASVRLLPDILALLSVVRWLFVYCLFC